MATLGIMASWATALFAGWALVAGLAADTPMHPVRRSAERALVASAVAALVASIALALLLTTGDFTINYVARSITQNLSRPYRLAAIWNLAAGAVLPTASLVALAGWSVARRAPSALSTAAIAAVVVALCAASLAATPFATLPWRPTDGLGLRPALQHPLSVVGAIALSLSLAGAAARLAATASALTGTTTSPVNVARDDDPVHFVADPALILTAAALAIATWCSARGAFETGVNVSPSPLDPANGALVVVTCAMLLAWRARSGPVAAMFAGSLALVGGIGAVVLGLFLNAGSSWSASLLPALALLAGTIAATIAEWRGHSSAARLLGAGGVLSVGAAGAMSLQLAVPFAGAVPSAPGWALAVGGVLILAADIARRASQELRSAWAVGSVALVAAIAMRFASPPAVVSIVWSALAAGALALVVVAARARTLRDARVALLALMVSFAASAAAGEGWGTKAAAAVSGGATTTATAPLGADFVLAHQGISRYEDGNAHVEAIALEVSRNGRRLALLSADRREYVDSRDELLGPATRRPAFVTTPLQELRVQLADVERDERVSLQLSVVPFALGWWLAPLCLVLLSASLAITRGAPRGVHASSDIVLA